jgi:hypothetical protein
VLSGTPSRRSGKCLSRKNTAARDADARDVFLKQKRRRVGPPRTTGSGVQVQLRCHKDFLSRVDDWQSRKAPKLSRPQAIKLLAEIGLDHEMN